MAACGVAATVTTTAPGGEPDDGVAIRRAERADLLEVARIEKRSFPQPWPFQAFEQFLEEPGFLVAADGPTVAGYVVADTVPDRGHPVGHVKDFAVHPELRDRGVGTRLLDRALSVLEGHGAERAKLEVRQTNESAISLYRRFGFTPSHLISSYYADGEAAAVLVVHFEDRWRPFD